MAVTPPATRPAGREDPAVSESDRLLIELVDQPWGQVSPSVYETARLVTLAPWLRGHDRRLRYLAGSQRPDGRWVHGDGYGLVPTLSAVEAALSAVLRGDRIPPGVMTALDRGLVALFGWLRNRTPVELPDTPAIELIVPALLDAVNAHLVRARRDLVPALDRWTAAGPLPLPAGFDDAAVTALRAGAARAHAGTGISLKLLHSLEVATPLSPAARALVPTPPGTIGASPAATAAWLAAGGRPSPGGPAARYLARLADRHGGPVPSVVPITTFERAWVLNWLIGTGVTVPEPLVTALAAALGPAGASGGSGLPPDADTTSVVLTVLGRLGRDPSVDCLLDYDVGTHFCTWPGERTASVSTNAHVLEALGWRLVTRPELGRRYGAARRRVVAWLAGQQRPDGSWTDKWHASPYYATACATVAVARFGGLAARTPVARSVRWLVDSQRPDGSWGRWAATREETAYALHVLATVRGSHRFHVSPRRTAVARAVERGRSYLLGGSSGDDAPLWHDKDLYRPAAVVRACVLSALHATRGGAGPQPWSAPLSTM
jgi:halimadienyl-diphosphate synthase